MSEILFEDKVVENEGRKPAHMEEENLTLRGRVTFTDDFDAFKHREVTWPRLRQIEVAQAILPSGFLSFYFPRASATKEKKNRIKRVSNSI